MRRAAALMVCVMLALLAGCESQPGQSAEDLPPINSLPNRSAPPPRNPDMPTPRALVYVQRIVLPLDRPTDPAWDTVDEEAFPQVTRSVWNANGLRIGVIGADQLGTFGDRLPAAMSVQNQKLLASEHPTPVRQSPPLAGRINVDLTIPPLAVREERITGGRVQLLLNVDANNTLYLTPHHYKPQASLRPRTALEKELDGRVYRELALVAALGRRDVLVVGLHRPWPLRPDAAPDEPNRKRVATGEDGGPPREDPLAKYDLDHPPPLPDDLGRALFTVPAAGHPSQVLLLITVEPLRGGSTFAP